MTLEEYFRQGVIDHAIRAHVHEDTVKFYIHADGQDSPTLDFQVVGDSLIPLNQGFEALLKGAGRAGLLVNKFDRERIDSLAKELAVSAGVELEEYQPPKPNKNRQAEVVAVNGLLEQIRMLSDKLHCQGDYVASLEQLHDAAAQPDTVATAEPVHQEGEGQPMSERKYRAWSPTMKAMLGWEIVQDMRAGTLLQESPANIPLEFTGLCDTKSSREIYEGDVVLCGDQGEYFPCEYNEEQDEYVDTGRYVVAWQGPDYPAFDLKDGPEMECNVLSYLMQQGRIEVIGNIYEHPELLNA